MKSWVIVGILLVVLGSIANASTVLMSQDPVLLAIEAGNHYAKRGEHTSALEWFERAIELDPLSAIAHHNKGVVYYDLGQSSDAVSSFQDAINADPIYAKAHYSLALEQYHQRQYDVAIEELHEVVGIEPHNAHAHFDLGVIYVEQFRAKEDSGNVAVEDLNLLKEGLTHYEMVLSIDPEFSHAKENAEIVKNVLDDYLQ